MMWMRFRNREEAGRRLAEQMLPLREEAPRVLALPRGGLPVAFEIAMALQAPLEVLLARKLGVPSQPELELGAIAEGGATYINPDILHEAELTEAQLQQVVETETRELQRRLQLYRGNRPLSSVRGHTAILVDDGLATGGTARAAVRAVRELKPRRLVVAVPVATSDTLQALRQEEVDDVVVLEEPDMLSSVGAWYEDYHQVDDEEVLALLLQARNLGPTPSAR
jgi:putative phosphoribosyl transferase